MLKLGKIQTLKILREKDFGVFVGEEGGDSVLLPIRQVPKGKTVGDEVSVFLYKDSKDRLIATTKKPYLEVGEIGRLRVSDVNSIGAFVDIGLEKDILVPHREMRYALKKDRKVHRVFYTIRAEYVKAYTLGDSIFPRLAPEEGRTVVAFYNQNKELCCHVEIRKNPDA